MRRLDTSLAEMPSPETLRERSKATGVELHVRGARNSLALDAYDLTLATELELPDGRILTVDAAASEFPEGGKVRCQAPFRDSSSFAAFLRRGKDGRLCVHDVGTGTTHWLKEDIASQFADLDAATASGDKATPAAPSAPAPSTPPLVLFDPSITRLGDVYSAEPQAPNFIVYPILPQTAGNESAIGGAGKSSRHQYEAIHINLGLPLYGCPVVRPGPVLFVTREDDAAVARYRMHHIMRAMGLSDADARRVAQNYHILDLVGTGERLITADRAGNLVRTKLAERLCRSFEREGLVHIEFDPINLFGPGEKHVNDGEAALLDVGHAISRELGCAVRFTTHVSKVVGREGIVDAHSGRGGSALGDNARFVWNYLAHEKEHKEYRPPASALAAAERGDLYRLHISKLSWAARPKAPIWIERDGWSFKTHEGAPESNADRLQSDAERVATFLEVEAERGVRHTRKSVEDARGRIDGKPSRDRLRDLLNELERAGRLQEVDLPPEECRGAKKTYLVARPASLEVPK